MTARLTEERRARLAAQRLLEQKQAELFAAQRKLKSLSSTALDEFAETRAEVGSLRDENARVRGELEIATRRGEIAERRLWESIEAISDGFAVFDDSHRLVAANPAFLSVFDGVEEAAAGVTYVRLLQILTEEGIIDLEGEPPEVWRARMMARWQQDQPERCQLRFWNGSHVKMLDRRTRGGDVVVVAHDVTRDKRHAETLRRAREKAEGATRAKSAFLANMSHEIRTPMNGVIGMATLLAETELDEDQRLYVDTIRSSAEALLEIINAILDYSKVEAGQLSLTNEAFDLNAVCESVVTLLRPVAEQKGLTLDFDWAGGLSPRRTGDGGRIRQVLINLLGNAIKFTEDGGVALAVSGGPGTVSLAVADTGIGIAEEKQGAIFGEFTQIEDEQNRKFEGTGLGLSITARLVALMGGVISVTSALGEGSVFTAELPLEEVTAPRQRPLVLTAEDNKTNQLVFSKTVAGADIDLHFAGNGAEAVALYKELAPDLIFMDISMPEMDGVEATGHIRALEAETGQHVHICAVTAHTLKGDSEKLIEQGLDEVLSKPLRKPEVLERIERARQAMGL